MPANLAMRPRTRSPTRTARWGTSRPASRAGPIGFVYHHAPIKAFFGPLVDLEAEGNHDLCNFSLQNHDECDQDGDAGLIVPRAYDLVNGSLLSACPQQGGAPSLPGACQRVTWGADIDIAYRQLGRTGHAAARAGRLGPQRRLGTDGDLRERR
jgi:hypothetical protein